ncbi:Hypothetical_protein [Hexamita inflata]|uniref:Hypothetical_protein n=1 Tax=Hexamita inflata TaxID=28002 RepID=A0AA86QVZ1_9EUKA|nr:Hypothetical protein HINF_LOCUS54696 [Hexamita inflata]
MDELLNILEQKNKTKLTVTERQLILDNFCKSVQVQKKNDWWSIKLAKNELQAMFDLFELYNQLRKSFVDTISSYVTGSTQYTSENVIQNILYFEQREIALQNNLNTIQQNSNSKIQSLEVENANLKQKLAELNLAQDAQRSAAKIKELQGQINALQNEVKQKQLSLEVLQREMQWKTK